MKLALSINGTPIEAPAGVPTGGIDTGQKVISLGFNLLFVAGIIITIAIVIYSGIQWTLSGGEKEKIASARARLTLAIIGLVVIVTAFAIVRIVLSLLGYNPGFFFNFQFFSSLF